MFAQHKISDRNLISQTKRERFLVSEWTYFIWLIKVTLAENSFPQVTHLWSEWWIASWYSFNCFAGNFVEQKHSSIPNALVQYASSWNVDCKTYCHNVDKQISESDYVSLCFLQTLKQLLQKFCIFLFYKIYSSHVDRSDSRCDGEHFSCTFYSVEEYLGTW